MSLWISGSAQRSTFHVGLVASSFEPHFVVEVAVLSRKSRPKPAREDTRPYSYKSLITHHLPWLRLRRGNPGEFMAYGRGIVLAVCMAIISLSDNAVFQIAACWMLPLAYAVVSAVRLCIKVVRLHVLPVASVAVVEATLVPSTNNSNAVPLRLNATECQFPSNAVPPEKPLAMTVLLPRA